jgi:NADH-quinone oxidoreductase subunit C
MTASEALKGKFSTAVLQTGTEHGVEWVRVSRDYLRSVAQSLKNDFKFDMLMDLFAVDYLHWEEKDVRFEVVYNLYSLETKQRLFLKVAVTDADASADSVTSVWPAADWYERETWDMMGIRFNGHPNLKRILMYEEFQGHALRKDYRYNLRQPLIGPMN